MTKDNFPVAPSNATGPPGPDYNTSGDKTDREPPGGYLGENKKKGNKGKNKGNENCSGNQNNWDTNPSQNDWDTRTDPSNWDNVKPGNQSWNTKPAKIEPDPTEPDYRADVWDYIHYGASRANNNPSEMRQKISSASNLDARGTTTQYTPMHVAVKFDQIEAVRQLINAGARVDLQDILGQTPLSLACCFDIGSQIPRLLIKAGADVEAVDRYSWRPLFWAARKGFYDDVQLLVNSGANTDARDKNGKRPYDWAANQSIRNLLN